MKWRQHHSLQLQHSYMFWETQFKEFQEPFFFSFQRPNEIEKQTSKQKTPTFTRAKHCVYVKYRTEVRPGTLRQRLHE